MKQFLTVHPKNGYEILVKVDEDYRLNEVTYYDDGEDVDLSMDSVKQKIEDEIKFYYDL